MTIDIAENEYYRVASEQAQLEPERHFDVDRFGKRELLVREYAWAIPNNAALDQIARCGSILEIGAGGGYWAHLLQQRGVDIIATDNGDWPAKSWTEVRPYAAASAVESFPGRALFTCWPSMARWGGHALRQYAERGGDEVIYVGEPGPGGCTGDDYLHEQLEDEWMLECRIEIPQYVGLHDALFIYSKGAAR